MFLSVSLVIPLSIGLFFASGKITSTPTLWGSRIHEMNNFGCCSQGLVFSRGMAQNMIEWYEDKKIGFVDMLTEEFGNIHGLSRWAISPSVLQHVGGKSSKGDDTGGNAKYERTVAEKIWSFEFENYNAVKLRNEHNLIP
jgi:hypothetical protein